MTRILTNLQTEQLASWSKMFELTREGDEQAGVSGIGKGRTTSVDTDRDTADQVACANGDTTPEESIASVVAASRQDLIIVDQVELG